MGWTESFLSESFETREHKPSLELKVEFFNINAGMNVTLMEHCKTLSEYMQYVNLVRENAERMSLQEAVNEAVDTCIRQGVLSEFLRQNKAEVTAMSIFEYDEEAVRKLWREDALEDGYIKGHQDGLESGFKSGFKSGQENYLIQMVLRKMRKNKPVELIAEELDEEQETVARICAAAEKCGENTDAKTVYEYLKQNEPVHSVR